MALIVRLLAAIFSKGFGMLDDHFIIVEIPQGWVNGSDEWFRPGELPHRNLIYPGLHYLILYFFDKILFITDPQIKMFFVRLLHAVYSVLIVTFGYKITERLSGEENAKTVGLLLAFFWPLPFLSVRSLVEVFCIPPILAGLYYLIKPGDSKISKRDLIIAGILVALGFALRFQVSFFAAGIGLFYLWQKKWLNVVWFSFGFLVTAFITLGLLDYFAWGIPFYAITNYIKFNLAHKYGYVTLPWYNYLLLLAGIFIPPVSFYFYTGFIRMAKKLPLLFLPSFLFLFFHSYFPNKQERFVLPLLPFFIILGIIGWNDYIKYSTFWQTKKRFLKGTWIWFWSLNLILTFILTFTYSKKNRVESLYYLSNKNDITGVIWESNRNKTVSPPKFYLNKEVPIYPLPASKPLDNFEKELLINPQIPFPNYIVFLGEKGIQNRVEKLHQQFKKELIFEKEIEPSLIDFILHKLNPEHNINQTSYIYRIE